jgi:hypothetical protein
MVRTRRLAGPLCSLLPLCIRAGGRIVRFSLRQLSLLFPPPFRPCPLPPAQPLITGARWALGPHYMAVWSMCMFIFMLLCSGLPLPHSGVGVVHLNSVLGPGHLSLPCLRHVFSIYVPGTTWQRCPLDCSAPWAFATAPLKSRDSTRQSCDIYSPCFHHIPLAFRSDFPVDFTMWSLVGRSEGRRDPSTDGLETFESASRHFVRMIQPYNPHRDSI